MEKTIKNTELVNYKLGIINRKFDVNWEKINTVNDIKALLKGLQLQVNVTSDSIPEHLKELFERDLLIERV